MFNIENDIKDKKTSLQTLSYTNNVHNNYIGHLKTNRIISNGQNDKRDRGDKILKTIKDLISKSGKKDVSIKDISNSFNCSEKTLQRELNDLVSKGQIKKLGSKRWSRYELEANEVRPLA
jgi:predicted HTH transcriptional regulator